MRYTLVAASIVASAASVSSRAFAVGEGTNGFPSWNERVIHEWMNRARVDPQVEMIACGSACADKACYAPMPQLAYDVVASHASRFHSYEMAQQGYFAHDSACTIVSNINTLYPGSCNGAASCACQGGTKTCGTNGCTSWSARVQLFGAQPTGEIIAGSTDPNGAFYQWLFESFPTALSGGSCAYVPGPPTNGHRWNILKSQGAVGVGVALGGGNAVGDFTGRGAAAKIQSGSHYPRSGASVEVWVNFADSAPPQRALVNVDGTCTALTRGRGTDTNGAWTAKLTALSPSCHRYYFAIKDATGADVLYPTTGSLGIGPAGSCADWDMSRPAPGTNCDGLPPGQDAGTSSDGGAIGGDGGGTSNSDGGNVNDAFPKSDSGCACDLASKNPSRLPVFLFLLIAAAIGFARRLSRSAD